MDFIKNLEPIIICDIGASQFTETDFIDDIAVLPTWDADVTKYDPPVVYNSKLHNKLSKMNQDDIFKHRNINLLDPKIISKLENNYIISFKVSQKLMNYILMTQKPMFEV